uniref:HEPN domain-containing protein n=1 Tax=Thermofilum pendens TaxID=2269 RepID=A0A7C1P642_THEPE
MSVDPVGEARYRYRLAASHLARAERLLALGDWAGVVHFAQLAVENFAKAVIALYEVPTWSHDPSNQLLGLLTRIPQSLGEEVRELALIAREVAPEHGRSTYGEPGGGLTPDDVYTEAHARDLAAKARRAREITVKVFRVFNIAAD